MGREGKRGRANASPLPEDKRPCVHALEIPQGGRGPSRRKGNVKKRLPAKVQGRAFYVFL